MSTTASAVPSVADPRTGAGVAMYRLAAELYPICRSVTGEGVRATLARIRREIPLEVHEVPTGTRVFDWTVPREWNIRDAFIKDASGRRVVDFRQSNLHVVGYSVPVRGTFTLEELRPRLHTLPEQPDWIPYRTAYYAEDWGFCLRHRDLLALDEGPYEVSIESSLEDGHLTYGEHHVPGEIEDEILLACHVCHPSLCNDNLSGIALVTELAARLGRGTPRHSFRFLFLPVTIGAITWLALNEATAPRIRHGLVVACVGDGGAFTYKRSRRGAAAIDRAVEHVLAHSGLPHDVVDFSPYGYDERQFCSPGFDLPVGRLTRTPNGAYPEYHTSADDLDLIRPEHLETSLDVYERVIEVLEGDGRFLNLSPKCEPQLGRRGLYDTIGGHADPGRMRMALLWVLNRSDGGPSLLEIAAESGLPFAVIREAADALAGAGLLEPAAR